MPWIKIWAKSGCSSDYNTEECKYVWYDEINDAWIKDEAYEWGEEHFIHDHYGFNYGHEVLEALPTDIRDKMIENHKRQILYCAEMIHLLQENRK